MAGRESNQLLQYRLERAGIVLFLACMQVLGMGVVVLALLPHQPWSWLLFGTGCALGAAGLTCDRWALRMCAAAGPGEVA